MIELQRAAGLRTVTVRVPPDLLAHGLHLHSLDGIVAVEGSSIHVQFRSAEGEYDYAPPAMRVSGKVGLADTIFAGAFAFLRDNASAQQTPKLTVPSPSMVHYRGGNSSIDESVYPELGQFWGT